MGPLIVAGMHRSGTSLVASLLAAAGVDLGPTIPADAGNPHGYHEDARWVALHQEMLRAAAPEGAGGWPDWGVTEQGVLDRAALERFVPAARALLAQPRRAPWGWKDPRTTLLLDFWAALAPDARFVFVHRPPWDVVDSIGRLDPCPFPGRPDLALKAWSEYGRAILRFVEGRRERCLVIAASVLTDDAHSVLQAVGTHLGVPMLPADVSELVYLEEFAALSPDGTVAELVRTLRPDVAQLARALARASDLPASDPPRPALAPRATRHRAAPDVSVIVPCFEDGRYVEEAVASCRSLAGEVLVVDDGSREPETLTALDRLRRAGVAVLTRPHEGLAAARNAGVEAAAGRYVLFLDADNRLRPPLLVDGPGLLDARPTVGAVYGDAHLFGDEMGIRRAGPPDAGMLVRGNTIDACALVRRELLADCGGFDRDLHPWEDWDLWLGALERGWILRHAGDVTFDYRVRGTGVGSSALAPERGRLLVERLVRKHPSTFAPHLPAVLFEWSDTWAAAIERQAAGRLAVLGHQLEAVHATRTWRARRRVLAAVGRVRDRAL